MTTRMEHDTMGEIAVPADHHWGAQTQRSLENFKIGWERQPKEIITAFAYLKEACALANADCGKLTAQQAETIAAVCGEIRAGQWDGEFPLSVWQTGSGTQTNMNVNEVIAHLAAERGIPLHPNDQVNASQSSNDTFPSALHIAAALAVEREVIPAAERLVSLDFDGMGIKPKRKLRGMVLSGSSPDDFNEVGAEDRVVPRERDFAVKDGKVALPPHSLTVLFVE